MDAAAPPPGSMAEAHTGLAVGFPLHPEARDYAFWDATTQMAVPAKFTGDTTVNGRAAYGYAIHAAGPVKDSSTLGALPPALPKAALVALAPTLPAEQQAQLGAALPLLPDSLTLAYTATTEISAAVDQATGWLLSLTQHQTVIANLVLPSGVAPLAPVLDMTLSSTEDSIAESVADASDAQRLALVITTGAPVALLAIGLLLVGFAVVSARRRVAATPDSQTPVSADA
jgi:hypothetical protein